MDPATLSCKVLMHVYRLGWSRTGSGSRARPGDLYSCGAISSGSPQPPPASAKKYLYDVEIPWRQVVRCSGICRVGRKILAVIPRTNNRASVSSLWESDAPIRSELFSAERLEQHAESLAAAQRIAPRPGIGRPLATRLRDNERILLDAYRTIAKATQDDDPITAAAEWLVDNYHVVEAQIREIRDDLPPKFYRQLPKLADGPFAGYPRVFGIAWAFVAHTDSRFDSEMLCRFVRAHQRVQLLTIGELWAVAITLRIMLVENLRRAAKR